MHSILRKILYEVWFWTLVCGLDLRVSWLC